MTRLEYLKNLKVEIFSRFKLSDSSIKSSPLKNYEWDLIYQQFKNYSREDIREAIKTPLKNKFEYKAIAKKLLDTEIKNYFCRHKSISAKTYEFLSDELDISIRNLEIKFRELRKEGFFNNLGITEEDFKQARLEPKANQKL